LQAGRDRGPLHGIPFGITDMLFTREGPTTAQSSAAGDWSCEDGPVVRRLRSAGAIVLGKTSTMEFAVSLPDATKPFPIPRNLWNLDYWTGRSSSGSASAVASGFVAAAIGTDTGGVSEFLRRTAESPVLSRPTDSCRRVGAFHLRIASTPSARWQAQPTIVG
jgi:aspartyl-tRNA(Asn)/glutamyl-tRNA(Gln) amidotransferase subunit A